MTDHDSEHEIKTYPLSPAQERVLAETLLSEDDSVYNMVSVMRIRDRWDDTCFAQAFRLLGVRFPVLRTVVFTENGVSGQYVDENRSIPCSVVTSDSIEEFLKEETSYRFDPYSDCLFRGRLVHGKDCDKLIENAHHIILDGFSYYLVNKELIRYHDLLRSGAKYEELESQAKNDAENDLSYEKYVRMLADKNKAAAKEYWNGLMSGYEGGEIKPYPTIEGGMNGRSGRTFRMPNDLYERIKAFCSENLMTVSVFAKAVWGILLKKYAYAEDIVFGDAVSGRSRGPKELKNAVGLFFNVIPVRVDLKKGKSVLDLCAELRSQQVKGSAYGYLPLEETLSSADVGSVGTFFNFMPQDAYYYSEDDLFRMEKIINYSGYDLEWYINCGREFTFELNYNTALYSEEDAVDLAERIFSVFRFILDHPDCSVDEADALSEKDKKFLSEYNRTEKTFDKNETAVDRFEKQAKKTPERTAVSYYGRTLSYRELDEKANGIAAFLRDKGVKKGDCVALYLHRSPEMIASVFGVLKAGAVYLPLDESYPEERLSFVLSDSGAVCVLTDGLEIGSDLPTFDVKDIPPASERKVSICGEDRAYYIYTSGTTGVPKGVITLHKGLSNLLLSYEKIYDLTEKDVVLQVASYTFDQSVWDIFGVLCAGGKLALISYDDVRDPERIALRCKEEGVTIASFTPAMIAELDPNNFPSLRILDSSGEAASASVLKRWVGKHRVINTYGPTEYTVNSCSYEYKGLESENIPIGRPILNTRFFVLDKGGALCGRGMLGELCIAGEGLAEGYLNRAELTEQKFTAAFDGKGKMYRTGDLVFWNKDGNIVFVDRIDGQVKIRGYRIELGEVENAIRDLPGIKDCYVRVVERTDAKALVAYLVGEDVDVRNKLSERLPGYMAPQYYVTLDRIPRTVSGKVDKKALPGVTFSDREKTLPSTPKEKILAVCWKEVLGEKAYLEDDFIESGGDSIKAIRLSAKLFAAGIDLSVKQIMREKTFERMVEVSSVVSAENNKKQGDISEWDVAYAERKFGKRSIEKIYRLTPLQEGMLFRALYDEDGEEYKTQIVIEMPTLDLNVFSVALNLASLRYEVLRTAFLYTERGGLQVILKDRKLKISSASGNVEEIAAKDRALPFDIGNDSLCRIIGVRDGEKNYLIQSSHHLILDGWSSTILLSKLREYYMRLLAGEKREDIISEIEKEKKNKSTFKDFVEAILSKDATEAAAHYKKLLSGFAGGTEYPSAGEKKSLGVAVERYVDFPDISDAARKAGVTEAVLYQVAWGVVLGAADLSGDAMFGNVLSGRTERLDGVEEIVGMCINTVPVRVRYDENTTLADVIADVEKQNEDNTQYGFLPLSSVAQNIGSITVFESSNERTSAVVKSVFDQTEYDLELQTTGTDSRCILRYNDRRYTEAEIDRLIRMMTSVFDAMKKDPSVLVNDIPLLTESEKGEYRTIKSRNPNKEKVSVPIPLKTEKERLVASCMEELLSVKTDDANADFFDLGGDSISAIRLSAKLRSAGYKATVKQIMTLRTIEKIASDMTEETVQSVLKSGKVGYGVTFDDYSYAAEEFGENMIESINRITPLQEGMLFYALSEDGPAYITQAVVPVPPLDVGILKGALRLLSRKYEVLRSNFIWTETGGLQVVLKDRFPEVRTASGSVKEIAEQDLLRGFDLKDDSLFRVTYVKDGEQNYIIKNIHHLLADGWSDAIITEEMKKIYYGILSGEQAEEEPAPAFATYIEYLYRKDKTKAKEYYAELMRGFAGSTKFPSRKKKESSGLAQEKAFKLPGIKKKADALSVRPSDIAQAVWGVFLAKTNVREDVVFGNVISGRNDDFPNMEKMVGMFINTVPVRVRTTGKTLKEVLSSVAWQSQNNLEYGFLPLSETGIIPESVVIYDNNEKDESTYSVVDQTGYDMELECFGEDCILRYNPDCYLNGDIDYAVQALLTLYKVMTESPDTLVAEVRLFNAELEKALLVSKKKHAALKREVLPEKPLTTEKEKLVASCIEGLLSVKVDNANADFFELGGDSISSIRLSAKLRSAGYKATVKQIMTLKTVAGIASEMTEDTSRKAYSVSKIGIGVKPSDYEYAAEVFGENDIESVSRMTPLQEGMLFYALTEDGPAYNTQTIVPVKKTDAGVIKKALDILARKYEVLRSNFIWTETGGLQVVLKNRLPELNVASGNVKSIAERDLFRGFDLKKDSLFRVTYVEGEQNYLIRNIHHLIADGWSDSILTNELKKIRDALTSGESIEEEKAPPFASYIEYLYRKNKEEAKAHYADLMAGFSGATGLPPASDASVSGFAEEKIISLPDLSKKAESLSVLPSDLIQTAWGILVAQANGDGDAVFGNVLSGRSGYFPGIENMVGMFINTVPVRVTTKDRTFKEALHAVKKQSEENAEYGFLSLPETGVLPGTVVVFDNFGGKKEKDCFVVDQTGYDMELEYSDGECILRYDPKKYPLEYADRIADGLISICDAIAERPDEPVSSLRLFDAGAPVRKSRPKEQSAEKKKVPLKTEKEIMLAACVKELLSVEPENASDDFFELGGDSISAIRLSARLRKEGYFLSVKDVMAGKTIAEMARRAVLWSGESAPACGIVPLTPVMIDFFERSYAHPDGYVQEVLLKSEKGFGPVRDALQAVYERHDMLRATYSDGKLVVPEISDSAPLSYEETETDDVIKTCVEARKKIKMSGPAFTVALIRQKGIEYLYLCAHHLVVDGVSWRVILEDISLGCAGEKLPIKTSSYLSWAKKCAGGVIVSEKEADFWRSTEDRITPVFTEKGHPPFSIEFSLTKEETRRLTENAGRIFGARRDAVMLAALARAAKRTFGKEETAVLMESHGRQSLFEGDISRTVGWFTSYYPVIFTGRGSAEECVTENKERLLSVPEGGVRYQFTKKKNAPDIIFNYMGEYDLGKSPLKLCSLPVSEDNPEREALDVEGEINNGVLTLSLRFNGPSVETGNELKENFRKELVDICDLCADDKEKILSPADLGYPGMPMSDFEEIKGIKPVRIAPLTPTQQGMLFHSDDDEKEYLEQTAVRLSFMPDVEKAEKLMNALGDKYAVLRSFFVRCKSGNVYQCVADRSRLVLHQGDDLATVAKKRIDEGVTPFGSVPIRLDLIGDVLLVTSHHALLDAWSEEIFIEEFEKLYLENRLPEGREDDDFCEYATNYGYLASAEDYAYWTGLIEGAQASFVPGHAGGVFGDVKRIKKELSCSGAVTSFALKDRVTENTVFEAAAALFMQRICGRDDVIFGKVVSGRDALTARAVGLYIATVPVRVRSKDPSDILGEIAFQSERSVERAVCPLGELYKRAKIQDPIGMLFVYDSIAGNARAKHLFTRDSTNYGITLAVNKEEDFVVDISFNDGEYSAEEIGSFLDLYEKCIEEITGEGRAEYAPLAGENVSYPASLIKLWNNKKNFTVYADKEYGAEEIRSRAESLAAYLADNFPKGTVAVRLERGVDMIVALLGVVLSGNAYLPIGVDHPEERVRFMCENAGAKVVIDKEFMSGFHYEKRYVADVKGDDICYVMYTSGSTGRPKGVKISHSAITNRLCWMEKRYPLCGGAILQKTPYTFDVSVWEIFRPLLFGGKLVLTPPGLHADPKTIADLVKKYSVTQAHFVPSVYDVYLEYCSGRDVYPVKDLFLSGEKLGKKTVEKHNAVFGKESKLHNLYGPTECAVDVTYYDVKGDEADVPIGKAVDNTEVSVLVAGRVAPPYVEGEIVVGGTNVGSGYIGRDRGGFIDGKYYTGDIGWTDKEGNIHFVGRKDRQIKWNGMRIEPGEIEYLIGKTEGVREVSVAVVAINKTPALCAFIVAADKENVEREIKKNLPSNLMPTMLVFVEKMPLTENGKLDKKALEERVTHVGRRSPMPRAATSLLDIVSEVAGDKIGFDTPFSQAGIGSLERIKLSVKLSSYGYTFSDIVRADTVRELYEKEHNEFFMRFSSGSNKAVFCIPYAGGTARIFEGLTLDGYDVYAAVGCTFEDKDWPNAIKEAERLCSQYDKVVLYAHCLGSLTALKLAESVRFDAVVFGAHVPDAFSSFFGKPIDGWKRASGKAVLSYLQKGGLKEEREDFAPLFKKDASRAAAIEAEKPKITASAILVLAENDPFTDVKKAEKRWKKFLKGEVKMKVLPDKDHYFISNKDFGSILLSILEGEDER